MTVVRNYVEPRWWTKVLDSDVSILDVYDRVPPLRWVMDAAHDNYKRVTHKSSDWYGWHEPLARCSVSLWGLLRLILRVPSVRWGLAVFGYRPREIELTISNTLACRHCGESEKSCTCAERELYVVSTSFYVDGQLVADEVFQEAYDRLLKARTYGWLLERIPR